ncbi:MAG: hypothetical protein ACOC31_05235 [Bacteroidota bacterium]
MNNPAVFMKKFLRNVTVFGLIVALAAFLFWWLAPAELVTPVLFYLIAFFYAITVIVNLVLINASREKFASFNSKFMLSTVLKLLLYMVIMISYIFINHGDAVNFLITFLALYVLFTGFEVISIVKATRRIKPEE